MTKAEVEEMIQIIRKVDSITVDIVQLENSIDDLKKSRNTFYERLAVLAKSPANSGQALIESQVKNEIANFYIWENR